MRYQPVNQSVSIVVIGKLNPAIFSPAWLRLHGVVSAAELEAANVTVIHPEVTDFAIDTLRIQVTPQKLSIITTELPFVRVADIMIAIFGKLLPHTPAYQLGINLQLHFNLESSAQRLKLGRMLAPTLPWGAWGSRLDPDDEARTGGLRSLTMEEVSPADRHGGFRRVQIEPSLLSDQLKLCGIFMAVNDHYELDKSTPNTNALITTIEKHFDRSINSSVSIVEDLMNFASGLCS